MLSIWDTFSDFPVITILSVAILSIFSILIFATSTSYRFSSKAPKLTSDAFPILGSIGFFTRRWDFCRTSRDRSSTGSFSYWVGKLPVIGLAGDEGRKTFFEERRLDFGQGYGALFGQGPNATGADNVSLDNEFSGPGGYFQRRMIRMLKKENFDAKLPKLRQDIQISIKKLETDPIKISDPFESIYRIVYHLTMRMVGVNDIADDPVLLEETLQLFTRIDESAAATSVLFPSLPSLAKLKQTIAGGKLYMIFRRVVEQRKQSGSRDDDALQYLIDQGDDMRQITEFIVGALFAGLLNSGINAAWVLVYLAHDAYWLKIVREEVEAAANKYNSNTDISLKEKLDNLSIEAWESEFPMLDLCLRESLRMNAPGTGFRKNVSGVEIPIGDTKEVIPPSAYASYPFFDVHMDPSIYTDPTKFDPTRYFPERAEDKKRPLAFIGWGAGRHPCLGMRFAKLEQFMITAYFVASFDFELSDQFGKSLGELPVGDPNAQSAVKPAQRPFLKYKKRV